MTFFQYATCTQEEIEKNLDTTLSHGITDSSAEKRLREDGLNEVTADRIFWWQIAIRQFKSPFIYLLLCAAGIVYIIGEYIDASVIVGFVAINTLLGFYQEYRSEQSLRALQQFISPRASVLRDSSWHTIDSRNLVRGDITSIRTGDLVPADVRILDTDQCIVDETTLTGESIPVQKISDSLKEIPNSLYESHNLCFSGTSVVGGSAVAVVVKTGKETAMGKIASLTLETTKESEFSRGIGRFSSFILRLILVTLVFVFVANILIKGEGADLLELLVFCIALVVSVVPEALPVVTTVSLSRGALKMARQNVIVKRLSAIEDIGGIEILCSDKTGTLTENTLQVTDLSPGADPDLMFYASLTVSDSNEKTEPFDIAIEKKVEEIRGGDNSTLIRLSEIPFDPKRRRNAVLIHSDRETFMIVRGAPEVLMDLSSSLADEGRDRQNTWLFEKGRAGQRTIALAKKNFPSGKESLSPEDEKDLQFLGMIAFTDPIKPSTYHAVRKAKQLGVQIKIITGDSPFVAGAVGKEIGLIDDPGHVLSGADLLLMPDDKRARAILDHHVIARVTPEQKYEIIETLQKTHTVGFLGEGINDAPALKRAGVSMVVESASDIAREAADVILLARNLEVIIDGIESGRAVFANSIKYLKATLASNFGHFYAIAIGSMFISFLPMLPLQILLVNLLSDFPMITIATDTVDETEIEKPGKYEIKSIVLIATLLGVVITVFDLMYFAFFFHQGEPVLQTNWFIGSILTELVFLFSIRSRLPVYRAKRPSGYVMILTGIAIVCTILLPYTIFGQVIFHFTPPTMVHLGIILGLVGAFFVCSELVKTMFYRYVADL